MRGYSTPSHANRARPGGLVVSVGLLAAVFLLLVVASYPVASTIVATIAVGTLALRRGVALVRADGSIRVPGTDVRLPRRSA